MKIGLDDGTTLTPFWKCLCSIYSHFFVAVASNIHFSFYPVIQLEIWLLHSFAFTSSFIEREKMPREKLFIEVCRDYGCCQDAPFYRECHVHMIWFIVGLCDSIFRVCLFNYAVFVGCASSQMLSSGSRIGRMFVVVAAAVAAAISIGVHWILCVVWLMLLLLLVVLFVSIASNWLACVFLRLYLKFINVSMWKKYVCISLTIQICININRCTS